MKNLFTILLVLGGITSSVGQVTLWQEDFEAEANGATSGTASGTPGGTWSTTYGGAGTFSRQNVLIAGNVLYASNVGTEAVWTSNNMDISSAGYAIISADVWSALVEANDYVRMYYKIDGGSEILFYELIGGNGLVDLAPATPASAIVSGSNVQIVIRIFNSFSTFIVFQIPDLYAIDNITVTSADILYSRKSGTWTDVTGGFGGTGTWSTDPSGTPACGCLPLNDVVAVVQNGHTVTLPNSLTDVDPTVTNPAPGAVEVRNGGILQFDTNNVTLGIQAGFLRVTNGGIINSSSGAITGERISYQANVGGARLQVDTGGSITIEDFELTSVATNFHYLEGGGSLSITDDVLIDADNASLENNMTSAVAISDRIGFSAGTTGADFINNGTFTAGSLFFDDDSNTFTNSGTATFSGNISANGNGDDNTVITNNVGAILSFVNLDGNASASSGDGGDMTIFNSGTINQTGTFLDIPANTNAANDINNLSGAIWNYSGTGHDTDLRLFANNGSNLFNYELAGAQQIITPVSGNGYSSLQLANSGAKSALANFSVYGDWTRSGTATFTPAGFIVTFSGTSAQTITAVGGETFAGLTINNTFATSPQVTLNNNISVTSTFTMTDGNINLNSNSFTIGVSSASTGTLSHGGTSASGWLYGGSLTRFMAASNTTTIGGGDQNEGLFPLGGSTDFRPFFVGKNSNAGTGGSITTIHNNSSTTSDVSISDSGPVATVTRRHDANWVVTTSGITGGTWSLRAGGTNFGTIQELPDLRLTTASAVVGTHSAATGSTADPRVNRTGLTFGQLTNSFHLSSTDATNSPLPVVLINFEAAPFDIGITLSWSTASELNNEYFILERSATGKDFNEVTRVKGKGTITVQSDYSWIDYKPIVGRGYYRLKQVDFDGTHEYSDIIFQDYNQPAQATFEIFPNPFNGKNLTVNFISPELINELPVVITNGLGQVIYQQILFPKEGRKFYQEIEFADKLPNGFYFIKVGGQNFDVKKLVVEDEIHLQRK